MAHAMDSVSARGGITCSMTSSKARYPCVKHTTTFRPLSKKTKAVQLPSERRWTDTKFHSSAKRSAKEPSPSKGEEICRISIQMC